MASGNESGGAVYTRVIGDLEATTPDQQGALEEARQIVARTVAAGNAPAPRAPLLPVIATTAASHAEPTASGEDFLVHRRSLPVLTTRSEASLPPWAAGRRIERSLGPFLDQVGRETWIDLFRRTHQVRLVRGPGAPPFLTLPIELLTALASAGAIRPTPGPMRTLLSGLWSRVIGVLGAHPRPDPVTYMIPAGSVWLASQLLASAAPPGSYTGLRITSGSLHFSQPISITSDEVVVPSAVTVELDLQLEAGTPVTGTGPGGDARTADAATPRQIRVVIDAGGAMIATTDTARLLAYGFDTELDPILTPIRYVPELQRLAVPYKTRSSRFDVTRVESTLFEPAGSAPIAQAAWGLPVAVIDPTHLGDADGAGALLLWLDDGLRTTWLGQREPARLGTCVLSVERGRLTLAAPRARGDRVLQSPHPADAGHDRIDLRWHTSFPLLFISQATGSEVLLTTATLAAVLDKPVDLRGEHLPISSTSVTVAFVARTAGQFLLIDGTLDPPEGAQLVAFALQNAILRTTYPSACVLYGRYDGRDLSAGILALAYHLLGIVPTLPDPYAASYGSLRALLDQPGGDLISITKWRGGAAAFDFLLSPDLRLQLAVASPIDPFASASVSDTGAGTPERLQSYDQSRDQAPTGRLAVEGVLDFERQHGLVLLDVSTNVDQFGVALQLQKYAEGQGQGQGQGQPTLRIHNLSLQVDGAHMVLLTVPAVQWEAVETITDPDDPTFPTRLGFANSGVPSLIGVPTVDLVPAHPAAALGQIVDNFAAPTPHAVPARFTLPFGILAQAELRPADPAAGSRGAAVAYNRPTQGSLKGAHQLRIVAVDTSLAPGESPSLPGYTVQLPVGQPGARSVLGRDVTDTFNSYLGPAGARPLIPVTRLDLSGYGESLFSDWRNPYNDPTRDAVAVVQARFDVLIGRTAYEVVKIRSFLFPYGVRVVRTLTIERGNNAVVTRHDSGWQAVSDGTYDFPSTPAIQTHPGVVRSITHVGHIRDTGQVLTIDGKDLAAVYFDGDLILDGAPEPAPVANHYGFVQTSGGALIGPTTYAHLIATAGALGGAVDARIMVGGGTQAMRLQRADVGVTTGATGPEFVMTAWGSLAFPGGGQWSVLRMDASDTVPQAVPKDRGMPLIRAGAAPATLPSSSPFRFADPADLSQPDTPGSDYGIVHAMGTQRVYFPRPTIAATDTSRIVSTQIPAVADPYALATAQGMFPDLSRTIPFPSATWALRVDAAGQYRLELPASTFPAGVGRRTTREAGSVKSDLDYSAAQVTYEVDTAQPVPWRFRLDHAAKIMNTTSLGDVIRLDANVVAAAGTSTVFEQPRLQMGGGLSIVQDLLTILADLGITGTMHTDMTNELSLKVAVTVPVVDIRGEALQIPAGVPLPDFKLDDTDVKCETKVLPTNDEFECDIEGHPMFAVKTIPGLYVVAIFQFSIKLSTKDGTLYTLLVGFGFAYDIEREPFAFKGLLAITIFGVFGDATFGFGMGFLLKLSFEMSPIFSIELSLEGRLAHVWSCHGTPDETEFAAGKLTFGVEVTVCLVLSISFEVETTCINVLRGPGEPACALPDVL